MRVIDARSGKEMKPGEKVSYPDGEWLRLDQVYPEGPFRARAMTTYAFRDVRTGKLHTNTTVGPLQVRFLHPSFLFQRVAFIPS